MWSSSAARAIALVAALSFATEARAQGGAFGGSPGGLEYIIGGVDASFALAGVLTGVGSTVSLAKERRSVPWFVGSLVTGTVNLGVGAVASYFIYWSPSGVPKFHADYAAIAIAHLAIGLWNVLVPTIGFLRSSAGASSPAVVPMVLSGRGPAGSRWSGVGFRVSY